MKLKTYILIALITLFIDVGLTVLVAWLMPSNLSDAWARILMFVVLIITTVLVYLIANRVFIAERGLRLYGAFVFAVLIGNILKYVSILLQNDWSSVHLLLIIICIQYVITDKKLNNGGN